MIYAVKALTRRRDRDRDCDRPTPPARSGGLAGRQAAGVSSPDPGASTRQRADSDSELWAPGRGPLWSAPMEAASRQGQRLPPLAPQWPAPGEAPPAGRAGRGALPSPGAGPHPVRPGPGLGADMQPLETSRICSWSRGCFGSPIMLGSELEPPSAVSFCCCQHTRRRAKGRIADNKYIIGPTLRQARSTRRPGSEMRPAVPEPASALLPGSDTRPGRRRLGIRAPRPARAAEPSQTLRRRRGGSGSEENSARDRGENIARIERTARAHKHGTGQGRRARASPMRQTRCRRPQRCLQRHAESLPTAGGGGGGCGGDGFGAQPACGIQRRRCCTWCSWRRPGQLACAPFPLAQPSRVVEGAAEIMCLPAMDTSGGGGGSGGGGHLGHALVFLGVQSSIPPHHAPRSQISRQARLLGCWTCGADQPVSPPFQAWKHIDRAEIGNRRIFLTEVKVKHKTEVAEASRIRQILWCED